MTYLNRAATVCLVTVALSLLLGGCASTRAVNAASQGDLDTLRALHAEGKSVDKRDLRRRTPLYQAAAAGHTDTVAFLLQSGADIHGTNESRKLTALIAAVQSGHVDTATHLLNAGARADQTDTNGNSALAVAVANGDSTLTALLLAAGADPAQQDGEGMTMLCRTARHNQISLMQQLLDAGANPNQMTAGQSTPLLAAATHDSADAVALLLVAGADPNLQDGDGRTAVQVAVEKDNRALLESLLAAGGNPNGTEQVPLLSLALKNEHSAMGKLLLAAGAHPEPPVSAQYSQPLLYAAQHNDAEMVALLLAAGADINSNSHSGFSSLYQAAYHGAGETLDQLLAAGADVNSRNGDGPFTPLMTAADLGHQDIAVRLLAAGADPNITTRNGYNALYYAVGDNAGEMVRILLAGGANPNLRTPGQYNWTPVHRAANAGHYEVLESLLQMGGNPNLLDADNDSPMDLALYKEYSTTPQVLARYGGRTHNYKGRKSGGDNFMRTFATVAIGATALQADLPTHQTADIMSASIRDIWLDNGQGNNLSQLHQQYASGNFQVRDPLVQQVFSASLEAEETNRRLQAQLAEAQAEQQRQQAAQQQALRERQQALAAQQAARQQQPVRRAATPAPQATPVAMTSRTPATVPASRTPPPAAAPRRVEPSPNSASLQRGRMQSAEGMACDCEGTITRRNLTVGSCQVSEITVAYRLGVFFGEPTVNGNFRWQAGANTPADCLPHNFNAWVKVQNDQAYGYVKIDPTVPKAGDTGFNVTGSPNWDSFICGFQGTRQSGCFSAEDAKQLLRKGRVTDVLFSLR
ncbi:ankyrin repeat domain-containing protein [Alcanivorax sp. S71-1-4]|uniref:ankyrin repeat domain-containing protein n=1 Tax=Alcanivorax sp. S71-1-4 TaxID=1177159 RepID=UPI0013593710|nr:ankyrin repeat domain-containing protein [Alcanivorax sp. S71-1-4]